MEFGRRSWCWCMILLWLCFRSFVECTDDSRGSLDRLLQEYARMSVTRTGVLYNASVPKNLSGVEVSSVRLRTGTFWARGADFSDFTLPPRILIQPFVHRLTIVYQNLGNRSSEYYNVPGYTMVAPVVGFAIYDATDTSVKNSVKLNITVTGDPISVHFPRMVLPKGTNSKSLKCVRFGGGGVVEFKKMASGNVCSALDQGHFSVVVPGEKHSPKKMMKERLWKWMVVGFALGFAALVVLGLLGVMVYRCIKKKKIAQMEKAADEGVSFEDLWIGISKMPTATVTRTQPALEHNEIP